MAGYILTSTKDQFVPEGIAGNLKEGDDDARILFYRSYMTGAQGARYELLRERQHTDDDVRAAKNFLRANYDVVSIHILKEAAKQF